MLTGTSRLKIQRCCSVSDGQMSRIPNVTKAIKSKNFHLTTFAKIFTQTLGTY
jgi:hypothetical protein